MFEEDYPDSAVATRAREAGGPDVFETVDVPAPNPGPGQLLVKTAAAGVNFIETYQRSGVYPVEYPFIPGAEGAGEILAIGEGVEGFHTGQRIATSEASGTYSTHFLVDAAKAVAVPDGVTDEQAAALPLQGATAHYLINSTYPSRPRPDRVDPCGCRRRRPDSYPAAQSSRCQGDHHNLHCGEGADR